MEQISNYNQELSWRLQQDITKYQEANQIFQKLDYVGYINQIYDLFYSILYSEYQFTVQELKKIQQIENEKFDFSEKYQVNSLIFKSNFQVICNSINDYLWVLFFNKAQQEFSKDQSISLFKSDQLNSGNTQYNQMFNKIIYFLKKPGSKQIDTQYILKSEIIEQEKSKDSQENERQQDNTNTKIRFDLRNLQNNLNKQIQEQQQQDYNQQIIQEQLKNAIDKKAQQQQQQNTQIEKNITSQQREEIIRESFLEDQQNKLNKYLNYDAHSRVLRNTAQTNMSVVNLQKNFELIGQNYPDLDRVINPILAKKDSVCSDTISKARLDSLHKAASSETEIQQIKMVTELLNIKKKPDYVPSIYGLEQQSKSLLFEKKFSTVKPQEFQEKLALAQQQQQQNQQQFMNRKFSEQLSIQKPLSGNLSKENSQVKPIDVQKQLQQMRNFQNQININNQKKNNGENLYYESTDTNNKLQKNNSNSGAQSLSTRNQLLSKSGKRSPSFTLGKTPKVS